MTKTIYHHSLYIIVPIIICTLLTACVPPKEILPEAPKQFMLISSKPEPTPEWVIKGTYEDTDKLLYFVGTSAERHVEERDALKQAHSDASNKFVEYCGVDAKVFSNYIESLDDVLSSQVQDETVSGTSVSRS